MPTEKNMLLTKTKQKQTKNQKRGRCQQKKKYVVNNKGESFSLVQVNSDGQGAEGGELMEMRSSREPEASL